MPLYHIQDSDRPGYVVAKNFNDALEKWTAAVQKENPGDEISPPQGVSSICDDNELIVDEGWKG